MAAFTNRDYSRINMTLEEAMEWAKYCRENMKTGEDLNYVWKQGDKEFVASWQ